MKELKELVVELNEILDTNNFNYEVVKVALNIEEANNENRIPLTREVREILETLALIKADEIFNTKIYIHKAIEQKREQFENFINRQVALTDEDTLNNIEVKVYEEGLYMEFISARNSLKVFITNNYKVIRKPRNIKEIDNYYMNNLNIKVY